jgi:hypothetical protein
MKNKINIITIIICACVFTLNGCATVVNGTKQQIQIKTPPTQNAKCKISNSRGTWLLNNTPGTISVYRAKNPKDQLAIICSKDGYVPAKKIVKSHVSGAAFVDCALGAIPLLIDGGSNAAYSYPSEIAVPMHKKTQKKTIIYHKKQRVGFHRKC